MSLPNEKLKKQSEPLPLLPELEFLHGKIISCEYQEVKIGGVIQYYNDKNGNPTTSTKKEFYMVVALKDHLLPNGKPRYQWIRLGASWGEKSLLPKVLGNLGFTNDDPDSESICSFFRDKVIKFQLANKVGLDGQTRQKVLVETIRNSNVDMGTINGKEIAWED